MVRALEASALQKSAAKAVKSADDHVRQKGLHPDGDIRIPWIDVGPRDAGGEDDRDRGPKQLIDERVGQTVYAEMNVNDCAIDAFLLEQAHPVGASRDGAGDLSSGGANRPAEIARDEIFILDHQDPAALQRLVQRGHQVPVHKEDLPKNQHPFPGTYAARYRPALT